MFSSVVCAANWPGWKREIASWAIALGDQPHLQDTLRALLEFHAAQPTPFASRNLMACAASGDFAADSFCGAEKDTGRQLKDFLELVSRPSPNLPWLIGRLCLTWTRRKITCSSSTHFCHMKTQEPENLGAHSRRTFLKSLGTVAATAATAQVKSVAAESRKSQCRESGGPRRGAHHHPSKSTAKSSSSCWSRA